MFIFSERRLRFAAFVFSLFLPCVALHAANFQITPIVQEIGREQSMAAYHILNHGAEPVTVQVTAWDWRQVDGERLLETTDRLMVVPPLAVVHPGKKQLVRVALKGPRPASELDFRVHFEEIPPAALPGQVALRTALKVDVPLFFAPESPSVATQWRLKRLDADTLRFTAANSGTRFARYSSLTLRSPGGMRLDHLAKPIYLLPGSDSVWDLKVPSDMALRQAVIEMEFRGQTETRTLTVE